MEIRMRKNVHTKNVIDKCSDTYLLPAVALTFIGLIYLVYKCGQHGKNKRRTSCIIIVKDDRERGPNYSGESDLDMARKNSYVTVSTEYEKAKPPVPFQEKSSQNEWKTKDSEEITRIPDIFSLYGNKNIYTDPTKYREEIPRISNSFVKRSKNIYTYTPKDSGEITSIPDIFECSSKNICTYPTKDSKEIARIPHSFVRSSNNIYTNPTFDIWEKVGDTKKPENKLIWDYHEITYPARNLNKIKETFDFNFEGRNSKYYHLCYNTDFKDEQLPESTGAIISKQFKPTTMFMQKNEHNIPNHTNVISQGSDFVSVDLETQDCSENSFDKKCSTFDCEVRVFEELNPESYWDIV